MDTDIYDPAQAADRLAAVVTNLGRASLALGGAFAEADTGTTRAAHARRIAELIRLAESLREDVEQAALIHAGVIPLDEV